jgi:hypothetical protein
MTVRKESLMEAVAEKPKVDVAAVVKRYVELRDQEAELKKEFEKKVEAIKAAKTKLENFLLKHLNDQGAESIRTANGTFFVSVKSSVSIADWDSYRAFLLKQEDPFLYLDRKANKSAIEAFKNEHQDLPDGLNWNEVRTVNVRR